MGRQSECQVVGAKPQASISTNHTPKCQHCTPCMHACQARQGTITDMTCTEACTHTCASASSECMLMPPANGVYDSCSVYSAAFCLLACSCRCLCLQLCGTVHSFSNPGVSLLLWLHLSCPAVFVRPAAHLCDLPEVCSGDSSSCPADVGKVDASVCAW